jgi:hypothetical protein
MINQSIKWVNYPMMQKTKLSQWLLTVSAVTTVGISSIVQPVKAEEQFNNQAIQFDRDTIVEFELLKANNPAQSTFGVINLATGEKVSLISESKTKGQRASKPLTEFIFKANTPYALYLESTVKGKKGSTTKVVYSNNDRNGGRQFAQFDNGVSGLGNQGVKISWNDGIGKKVGGSGFNQFMVIAGGGVGCPCKASPGVAAPGAPEQYIPRGRG